MSSFYDRLDGLYAAGDLGAVEKYIKDAIDDSSGKSPEQAGLYNELAGFYRGLSRFNESEEAFKYALDIFENEGMGATTQYATVLLNLAGLYRIMGKTDKSIELFTNALKQLENIGAQGSYAYISVLNNFALAEQEKGEYAKALEYASKALAFIRAGRDNEHELSASLNNLASINLQMNKLDAADSYITEALRIYDSMDEEDVHHAAALTTKAVISFRNGEPHDALDGFKKALLLTKRFFGENIEYAICRRNISEVYELLGDIPAAVEELTDAALIMARIQGDSHAAVIGMREKLKRMTAATETENY